jgi:hypothetical protein
MEVFSIALQKRTVKIMMVHNHPSGELHPSADDRDPEHIPTRPFGLREGLSRPCFVGESLTEFPTMLGSSASPDREILLARYQKPCWDELLPTA